MNLVLFVCTGNTCRSPMAEALFRHRVGADFGWEAASAGLCAASGVPATDNAVKVMSELQVNIGDHLSQPLTAELVERSTLIVVMTAEHRDHILDVFPEVGNRVCLINSFGTSKVAADVSDPFGGSIDTYRRIRDEIDRALTDLILFIRSAQY